MFFFSRATPTGKCVYFFLRGEKAKWKSGIRPPYRTSPAFPVWGATSDVRRRLPEEPLRQEPEQPDEAHGLGLEEPFGAQGFAPLGCGPSAGSAGGSLGSLGVSRVFGVFGVGGLRSGVLLHQSASFRVMIEGKGAREETVELDVKSKELRLENLLAWD